MATKKRSTQKKASRSKSTPPRKTTKRAATAAKKRRAADGEDAPKSGRSLWTGSIAFGLVQIPVRLLGAEKANELSFHQIDRRDLSRIRYQRINEETEEIVEWADIIKGYEMDDGTIVPIEDEDFEKANVEASHTIDIQDFVKREDIPAAYFEKPYYIVPQRSEKAYAVLRDAMIEKGYVAVALVVIRTRQHLCAVVPEGRGLVLEMLRFPDELKPMSTTELPAANAATAKELKLAEQLIDALAGEFDPKKYKDTFKEEMLAAIEEKAKTGKIPTPKRKAGKGGKKVTDLVALLKKSLAEGHAA